MELGEKNWCVVATTPCHARRELGFDVPQYYPDRFSDVGIAEQYMQTEVGAGWRPTATHPQALIPFLSPRAFI